MTESSRVVSKQSSSARDISEASLALTKSGMNVRPWVASSLALIFDDSEVYLESAKFDKDNKRFASWSAMAPRVTGDFTLLFSP